MSESRAYTDEEVLDKFLTTVAMMTYYWRTTKFTPYNEDDAKDETWWRMTGAIFSTLAILDGSNISLPAFSVAPNPHESDENYHRANGENFFSYDTDIGGLLHGGIHKKLEEIFPDVLRELEKMKNASQI